MCKLVGTHIEKYELILSEMNLSGDKICYLKKLHEFIRNFIKIHYIKIKSLWTYPIAHHLITEVSIMIQERTVDSREHQLDSMLAHKWSLHSWAPSALRPSWQWDLGETQRINSIQLRRQYIIWILRWQHFGSWMSHQRLVCCRLGPQGGSLWEWWNLWEEPPGESLCCWEGQSLKGNM